MKTIFALSLSALVLSSLVAFATPQTQRKISQKAKITPILVQTPAKKPLDASVDFTMVDGGVVTASYFRMHHADMLSDMADQVKGGQMRQGTLDSLITPVKQSALYRRKSVPAAMPPSTSVRTQKFNTKSLYSQVETNKAPLFAELFGSNVEFAPKEPKFPDVWDKQTVNAVIHVTSATDGPVTVSLGANSPFYIKKLAAYDGRVANVRVRSGGSASKKQAAAQTLQAPWTITTTAGQDVDITLGFSPHFDLFKFAAGYYKDIVTVSGQYWNPNAPKQKPWSVGIPVSGRFNGVMIGTIFYAEDRSAEAIEDPSYDPKVPKAIEYQVCVVNAGAPVTGTIVPEGLPAGVTMQPIPMSVGTGQAVHATLTFNVDRQSAFYLSKAYDTPYTFAARFVHGKKSELVEVDAKFYPGIHVWDWKGKVGTVDVSTHFSLFSTGDFDFSYSGFNNDLVFDYAVSALGDFGGRRVVNVVKSVSNNSSFNYHYGFNVADLKTNYLTYIQMPFHVHVATRGGL